MTELVCVKLIAPALLFAACVACCYCGLPLTALVAGAAAVLLIAA